MSLLIKKTLAILIIILSGFVGLTLTNEIRTTESAVAMLNSLLNHNGECPGNVTQVNNTHIKKTDIQKIGLCPFELTINYDDRRKPEVIVEAKCKSCRNRRCTRHDANCETLTEKIVVRDLNKNTEKKLERSIGCFCVSRKSRQVPEKTRSHSRRRRHTSK